MSTHPTDAHAEPGPSARADALLALGRHAEAIPWLERAIAVDPQAIEPRCRLVLTLLRLGQRREALLAAERAVALFCLGVFGTLLFGVAGPPSSNGALLPT